MKRLLVRCLLVSAVPAGIASAWAFSHMTSVPGLVIIAPGYLVQAWLFERHWAWGGAGYVATLIGVSTVFWSLLLGPLLALVVVLGRRFRGSGRRPQGLS